MPFEWKLTIIFVGQCQRPRLAEMAILPLSPNALTNRNKRKLPSNKSICRLNGNNKMFFSFQCMTFCGIVSLFSYWFLCKKKKLSTLNHNHNVRSSYPIIMSGSIYLIFRCTNVSNSFGQHKHLLFSESV